jgi:hypothetical protein
MLMSGTLKLVRSPRVVGLGAAVHVTVSQLAVLGSLQVASTVGLLAGVVYLPFAVAAAIGLVLYFCGAIIAHIRARDRGMAGAAVFLVLSIATLVVLLLGH